METVAFALRAEHEGTVEIDQDGETVEVPKFGGGVLAVGDGDFHLKDQLDAGDGVIVVYAGDQQLVELLRAVPVLKEVKTPKGAQAISRYERRQLDAIREDAQRRGISGAGSMSRDRVVAVLEAHDEALDAGDLSAALQIAEQPDDAGDIAAAASEAAGVASSSSSTSDSSDPDSDPDDDTEA